MSAVIPSDQMMISSVPKFATPQRVINYTPATVAGKIRSRRASQRFSKLPAAQKYSTAVRMLAAYQCGIG
jgi:hypothetical protein